MKRNCLIYRRPTWFLLVAPKKRGARLDKKNYNAPDRIREQLYQLYYWHTDVKLADIGNIQPGASLGDTYAALKSVIAELTENGKTVVILGGSHDLTLAQYYTYADRKKLIEVSCVDALIDLNIDSTHRSDNFLMEMFDGRAQLYPPL